MKLYDTIIRETRSSLSRYTPKVFPYSATSAWKDNGESSLILQRDAVYELGGSFESSVNFTCVTTSDEFMDKDEVFLYGPDLGHIRKDTSFARITFLEVEDLHEGEDEEAAYRAIRALDFVRYHVFPDGYMVRVSSESNQERVRIGKQAIKKGISFASVGNDYIRKYKEIPGVKHVQILFLVGIPEIASLIPNAKKVDDITQTLTHIMDGLATDCSHCNLKPVCDEVEGMRELHLAHAKKK